VRGPWLLYGLLAVLAAIPCAASAVSVEDVVLQPVNVLSDAGQRWFQDKFVFYEQDGVYVPNRLLIDTDIKACVDLASRICSMRYESKPEVLKAASIYFGYPIRTPEDFVSSTLRSKLKNFAMRVTTTWSMEPQGLVLHMDVHKQAVGGGEAVNFTRLARFTPSKHYVGLRMQFAEEVLAESQIESLSGIRDAGLRRFADAAIRINNHFYSPRAKRKQVRHGSGFFYRQRDLVMTAWHNLVANPACRQQLRCELRFLHTDAHGIKRRFREIATVVAHSETLDFAVVRLRVPAWIPARVLPIAQERVGPEVIVVGYPAPGFELLYSYGYLNGLTTGTRRLVASARVVGGFSGAPVIDLTSGEVVGLAKAWQRPKNLTGSGRGGPVSLNLMKVMEESMQTRSGFGFRSMDR